MKRSILRALALCLTTASVSGIAWAQDDSSKSSSPQLRSGQSPTPGSASQTSPATPGIYGGTQSSYSTPAGQSVRLSRLMNTSLRSPSGESLGQVQELVIDPTSGQIQFVVLSRSSSAGAPGASSSATTGTGTTSTPGLPSPGVSFPTAATTGGQLVAIPWRLVSASGQGQLTATVDQTTLQSAPSFSSSAWPTMDSAWMQSVYSHFGVNASSTGAPGSSSGTGTGTGTGLGNPSTPGVPSTPGTPDISPPGTGTTPAK